MRILLFIFVFVCSTNLINAQEIWGYIEFQIPNESHYGAIDIVDENQLHVVADNGYFYKTLNAGLDWTEYNSGVSEKFFDLKFYNTEIGFAVGVNGSILKTINGGDTWEQLNLGVSKDLFSISFSSETNIWIVGSNGIILNSTDAGLTWNQNYSLSNEKLNSVAFKNESEGYIAGNNGTLLYTANAGIDWTNLDISTTEDLFDISLTDNNMHVLAGYYEDNDYDYWKYGYRGFKTDDNVNWSEYYFFNPQIGEEINTILFIDDSVGFTMFSAALLCDCCYVSISKTSDVGNTWAESFFNETNAANCNSNDGYADLDFLNLEFGYALLGNKILTTNEDVIHSYGINEFSNNSSVVLFPNPSTEDYFNIKFSNTSTESLSIKILDLNGKLIHSESEVSELTRINTTPFETGIYFVNITESDKIVSSKKLIIQ